MIRQKIPLHAVKRACQFAHIRYSKRNCSFVSQCELEWWNKSHDFYYATVWGCK